MNWLRQIWNFIQNVLLPDRYFAWQTVLYMSLFSWLMSLIARGLGATEFTVGLLATLSWMFLALGVGWALQANNIKLFGIHLAPWVAGAIVCVFLFGSWGGSWFQPALAAWPLISFSVVAVPALVSWDFKLKKPLPAIRQQLVLLFLLSLLLSSWFQFYFRIQSWLQAYPSLAADSLEQSNFVYRVPGAAPMLSAGVTHLTVAETMVNQQLDGKPWSWVERWLLNLDGHRQVMQDEIRDEMRRYSSLENDLWRLDFQPYTDGDGYTLRLWAIWSGPTADREGYYLEKTCRIMPVTQTPAYDPTQPLADPTGLAETVWASVDCPLDIRRVAGNPRGASNRV